MARLFITSKEIQLIQDLSSEIIKDVIGQYIIVYPVSTLKTNIHPVYEEAIQKIFETPIKLDVLAGPPERRNEFGARGYNNYSTVEILVQARDMIAKNFEPQPGDFFVYGRETYEVKTATVIGNIFGQAEYEVYWKLESRLASAGQFEIESLQKLLEDSENFESSQVQKIFEQQRGLKENSSGPTNDVRQVQERLGDNMAEIALGEGPRVVKPIVEDDGEEKTNSFYNE
jgi:hypothetical protein